MRGLKLGLVIFGASVLTVAMGGLAYAFHSGGVAECGGCHSMHSPQDTTIGALLIKSDQSSTCLSCHENANDTGPSSYHSSTPEAKLGAGQAPLQRSPGGDFGWLKKSYTWVQRNSTTTEAGQTHGHNIIAGDYNYTVDTDNPTAPGGSFPSNQLACNSCHDQHGQYHRLPNGTVAAPAPGGSNLGPIIGSGSYDTSFGNSAAKPIPAGQSVGVYRILRGQGSQIQNVTFPGVPAAVAPATYNRTEAANQTRVAYGVSTASGHVTWGQWCATCHPAMHSSGNYVHPVDQGMSLTMRTKYSNYVSSGNMSGVFQAGQGPFLSLVPFATNSGDYTVLGGLAKNDGTQLGGPGAGDQVMCLSCHRAHASAFPEAIRWQMEGEFITYANATGGAIWPGIDNGCASGSSCAQFSRGRTGLEQQAGYYDRPVSVFGPYQRVLCNKCHAKD